MKIVASDFRAFSKNSLKGFVAISFEGEHLKLTIRDCMWHEKSGREWIGFPAKRTEKNGEKSWANLIELGGDRDYRDRIQAAMVKAIYRLLGQGKPAEDGLDACLSP
jgi:hypothetical protein